VNPTIPQQHAFHQAILKAFDESGLERLARFRLGVNLWEIVARGPLQTVAFELLSWTERHNRWEDLIKGALAENPSNGDLAAAGKGILASLGLAWTETGVAPEPGAADLPPSTAPHSPGDRKEVVRLFKKLYPEAKLDTLIFLLELPIGAQPSQTLSHDQRCNAVLRWAVSPAGPGLPRLHEALRELVADKEN
jgi:hypothetical protein